MIPRGAILEHGVPEGGIFGHPAVADVLAVGAIDAADPGNDEARSFSDRGPSEIYFPSRETRQKPDVMGIDGVLVTGSGGFGNQYPGGTGNLFPGTSAAAPHVAGIAALVMEAQRLASPSMTKKAVADSVTQRLRDTAIDLGEDGRDNTFGYGRADALAAIESIADSSDTFDLDSLSGFPDTYIVNSTGDDADSSTSDGVCDDGNGNGNGNGTLRAAIQQANAGTGAVIEFNISSSGTQTISPASALPTITRPVFIDGYSQSNTSNVLIELDGTNAGTNTNGLTLSGESSYVRGLSVTSFDGNGIVLQGNSGGQVIVGNLIGTDTEDATDHGNGAAGVYINGTPNVVLRNNVISGNTTHGIDISGSRASGVVIYGNTIGLNAAGTSDLGNTMSGIYVNGASNATLRDNVISGNGTHGVSISGSGASAALVEYNRIGTNADGDADVGNTGSGVHISGTRNVGIFENVIGGNDSRGISLTGSGTYDTLVAENYIGTNAGAAALANGGSGIHIGESARNNEVKDNTIANNGGDGVTVLSNGSTGNIVWENSIHTNTGLGIDLGDDGVTANDTGDTDSGPNFLQNFPSNLTFATRGDVASMRFNLDVTAGRRYIFDFYSCDSASSGEGKEWLGFSPATSSATGLGTITGSTFLDQVKDFTAPAPTATHITATATDTALTSTSEFAPCVERVALPELTISENPVEVTEGGTSTYTVSLALAPSADTTVKLSVVDTGVATVSPSDITFTTTDFSETVTVTGVADDDAENGATMINYLVSIDDNEFLTAVLPVEVTDDDAPVLVLTSTTTEVTFPADVSVGHNYDGLMTLHEGSTEAYTYTVELDEEPAGEVVISIDSTSPSGLSVSPASITFTKTGEATDPNKWQWDDSQTVTLTTEPDDDASDLAATIRHKTTIGGDSYVLGQVRGVVRDSGLPRLVYADLTDPPETIAEISVAEGGMATYSVGPATEPSSDLHVSVISSDEGVVTVMPSLLTFTVGASGNWQTAQEVTITGVQDADEFDDVARVYHATRFDGDIHRWDDVSVTVTDGNRAPYFVEGISTTREVPENAGSGTNVGNPVAALDLNSDTLTYTLDDQSGKFSINTSGQITVAASNSLDYETVQDYSMEVEVSDRAAAGLTDKIEVKVLVTDVNEPPVITGEVSPTFREDTSITSRVARYSATDPERDSFTWSEDSDDLDINASGDLRFNDPPDHETKATYSITIVATDDGDPAESGKYSIVVEVTDVNEAPEIHLGEASHNYDENSVHPVDQYFARDPEKTATFTWSLSGADRGDFTISSTGQLQFANPPDYERPADSGGNNVYNLTVRASDGSLTGTKDVTVTVRDVNEAPTIAGDATLSYPENTATTRTLDRYSATDPERGQITWSLEGADDDDFRIDQSGNLTFAELPDVDAPGSKNALSVTVVATDNGSPEEEDTFDVTVTVTPVDEPPVITGTTTISDYDENTLASNTVATYTSSDPEGDTNIIWSLAGADRGDFTITNGELKFASTPDH